MVAGAQAAGNIAPSAPVPPVAGPRTASAMSFAPTETISGPTTGWPGEPAAGKGAERGSRSIMSEPSVSDPSGRSVASGADRAFFDSIARAEGTAGRGDYNAVLGYGKYGSPPKPLTSMTLNEVYRWGRSELGPRWARATGRPMSTASGRYQIVGSTMMEAAKALGLNPETTKFSPEVQDRMAVWIAQRQGLQAWEGFKHHPKERASASAALGKFASR